MPSQPNQQIALYIHIPWCVKKCPYCDFNSHALKGDIPEKKYIDHLLVDLEHDLSLTNKRIISSIFIGGGTPSLFSAAGYKYLLNKIQDKVTFAPSIEITMEANPGTVEHGHFEDYQQAGINRISLGVQSFNDQCLQNLGRIHQKRETITVIEQLASLNLNFNLDLMHSLPHQTLEMALDDLQQAIAFKPNHISWYHLTIEPNTWFYHQPPVLPLAEYSDKIEEQGKELLKFYGYQQYEVSAFARDSFQSRHNLNYWQYGDYFGIGAGAHGKITTEQGILRTIKHKHPQQYLSQPKTTVKHTMVASQEILFEYMLNHCRLVQPIERQHFEDQTQLNWQQLMAASQRLVNQGLVEVNDTFFELTQLGHRFLNDIVSHFLVSDTSSNMVQSPMSLDIDFIET